MAAGADAAVRLLKERSDLRTAHQRAVALTRQALTQKGIPLMENASHIVPVMVGDPVRCKKMSDQLLERHAIYIQPINYPTVARGTERLRITPTPLHTQAHINELAEAMASVWSEMGYEVQCDPIKRVG